MPPFQYWFSGAAVGAFIALIVGLASLISLTWVWYQAALSEYKSSQTTAALDRDKVRLAEIRANLQRFYIEGAAIMERPIAAEASPELIADYAKEATAWATQANTWIGTELGQAASARFLDRSAYPPKIALGIPRAASDVKIFVSDLRQNLAKMIETPVWDSGAKK